MKIMKFGGTSVGKPERMHEVAALITKDAEAKIVVLSALSGTTNSLVEISNHLAAADRISAKASIDKLEAHYRKFVLELVKGENFQAKANAIVTEHFEFLNIILRISFSDALNKDILAQGELMSTKLFCVYLEEEGIDHLLLPALEFMSIDVNEEPAFAAIQSKLGALLQHHNDKKLFITQGYICKNAKGEEECVIIDFGLATFVDSVPYLYFRCGTPGFLSPEIANLTNKKEKQQCISDVFSIGCIFYKMYHFYQYLHHFMIIFYLVMTLVVPCLETYLSSC